MARISSYPKDLTIQDLDAWIGSDSVTRATKQYTAIALAAYLNGKISISAQMMFKFVKAASGVGDFSGPLDGSLMTGITTMQLSIVDKSNENVVTFMEYLIGNTILISAQDDISTFGHFTIDSYTASATGLYTLNLTNIGGSGNLTIGLFYDFALFTLSTQGASTFVFTQGASALTWNINHNLGRFPSITVIDTANTIVTGEYTYIDDNNVTLNFSAQFAGKAYLN